MPSMGTVAQGTSSARRRQLGRDLQYIREWSDLTGIELAALLECSPSTLSRLESGKRPATPTEIVKYATVCGVLGAELDALERLAAQPDEYRLERHVGSVADVAASVLFCESTACLVEGVHLVSVPSIVQTPDYAQAVFEMQEVGDAAALVEARMARGAAFAYSVSTRGVLYVHENALRSPVGAAHVMHEQLLYLVFANGWPRCDIRVIPRSAGARGTTSGSFTVYSFAEDAPVVHVENLTTSELLENRQVADAHRAILDRIAGVALDEFESNEFMMELAGFYESGIQA